MKIVPQKVNWIQKPPQNTLEILEMAGRTCYKSHHLIKAGSAKDFAAKILNYKHFSVWRHCVATVELITDRGVLAELTRHQLSDFDGEDASWIDPVDGAAYSVESTRYVDYSKRGGLEFVLPVWMDKSLCGEYENSVKAIGHEAHKQPTSEEAAYINGLLNAEHFYKTLRGFGWSAQQARTMLNMSTKTTIAMTCNLEQWRNVFNQRCSDKAHPQCKELMRDVLFMLFTELPDIFGDLAEKFLPEVGEKLQHAT